MSTVCAGSFAAPHTHTPQLTVPQEAEPCIPEMPWPMGLPLRLQLWHLPVESGPLAGSPGVSIWAGKQQRGLQALVPLLTSTWAGSRWPMGYCWVSAATGAQGPSQVTPRE